MKEIEFIQKRRMFLLISLSCVILTIIVLIINKGLNLGLDFTGGILIQVKIFDKNINISNLREILAKNGISKGVELQNILSLEQDAKEFIIKLKAETQESAINTIKGILDSNNLQYEIKSIEYVGPAIGKHLTKKALYAIAFSLLGIIVYVAVRFGSSIWGVAGVIALIHDVFLTIGFLTILGKEISLTVIAALLTLAGYSINDTIVIFDRIRENIKLLRKEKLDKIMNISINQTLTRTLLTSGTTLIAVLSLFILGNQVIKDFALSLVFGVIVGTYSSIFIASALVLEYKLRTKQ